MPTARSRGPAKTSVAGTARAEAPEVEEAEGTGLPFGRGSKVGSHTGRYLILLQEEKIDSGLRTLEIASGITLAEMDPNPFAHPPVGNTLLRELGVAIADMEPAQVQEMGVASAAGPSGILAMEPERFVYALERPDPQIALEPDPPAWGRAGVASAGPGHPVEYWIGYRDATVQLVERLAGSRGGTLGQMPLAGAQAQAWDERLSTWGLQATGVATSRATGQGISVAVLDTGLAAGHPDFAPPLTLQARSFVPGEAAEDLHGHGTHCAGTIAGLAHPAHMPRYGCAPEVNLFVGKVLSNRGAGRDGEILEGIAWAIREGCSVISMSLGAPVTPGQPFNTVYEGTARRALARGCLIIAAAGNDSQRPGQIRAVSHPANCPSIMAVAALDEGLLVAYFSNGTANPNAAKIDIAAPGVNVYSSYPTQQPNLGLYRRLNGTSMATPHVAGIAALWASTGAARGQELWRQLTGSARRIQGLATDIGAGLVQAPN